MVVGIFSDTFFPEINGVATSVMLLKRELEALGHVVHVFTPDNPDVRHEKDIENTWRLPSAPFIFLPSRRFAVVYKKSVARRIRSLGIDIIHTNTEFSLGLFGKIIALALDKPVVHTYHTLYKDYMHYITKGKFKHLSDEVAKVYSRRFCNSCDHVITPTEKTRDLLLEYEVERPITVVPTGVDLALFQRPAAGTPEALAYREKEEALRAEFGIEPYDRVILYVGRLAKEKNIDCVLEQLPEFFAAHKGVKFLLVGGGPLQKELAARAAQLGLAGRVVFAGERPWREMGHFYRLGSVFVSASTSETQGLTFIEAMAAECPVLAKNDRSVENLIRDSESGCLFDDPAEIPRQLEKILFDAAFRERIVEGGRQSVSRYDVERFAKSVLAVYKETIAAAAESDSEARRFLSEQVISRILL